MKARTERPKDVHVRPYEPKDYASVKKLYEEGGLFDPVTDREEGLNRKSKRDPESLLVAVKGNSIIGTISIVEDGRMALIFRLVVAELERRSGIGRYLMSEAEKVLKQKGHPEVNLVVNSMDEVLQGYYEKQGYTKHRVWRWMCKVLKD